MAGTAAARARIRTEEAAGASAADQALAGLGAAMRVAESADHAVDGAAAAVAAAAEAGGEAAVERVAVRGSTSVCPRCYSPNMAPSRRQTVAVRVLRVVGVELLRCRSCGKRSWWF